MKTKIKVTMKEKKELIELADIIEQKRFLMEKHSHAYWESKMKFEKKLEKMYPEIKKFSPGWAYSVKTGLIEARRLPKDGTSIRIR